jgi:hypothetical protein
LAYVVGTGIPEHALEVLENKNYAFIPGKIHEGIIQFYISDNIFSNRNNFIEGFVNVKSKNTKLILENPGDKEDSIIFKDEGYQSFKLSFAPKRSGTFLYKLILKSDSTIIEDEIFPVVVQEEKPFNILFLQQYPAFETKYLKTFLSKHHHLVFRYQVSKNNNRYEFINHKEQRVERLDNKNLSSFDLLIIDSDAFKILPLSELKALNAAIESGLGMIILFNESPDKIKQLKSFLPLKFKSATDTAQLSFGNEKKTIMKTWPIQISPEPSITSITKSGNRILSGFNNKGFGKTGFQLLQETYGLTLEGDSISYSKLWSALIEKVSRTTNKEFKISIKNKFPVYEDEPLHIEIISTSTPRLLSDSVAIPLKEDLLIDDVWHGTIWPDKAGWHKLSINEEETQLDYFVSQKGTWKSLATAKTINMNKNLHVDHKSYNSPKVVYALISPVIFFVLFLICMSFLWLAPKL